MTNLTRKYLIIINCMIYTEFSITLFRHNVQHTKKNNQPVCSYMNGTNIPPASLNIKQLLRESCDKVRILVGRLSVLLCRVIASPLAAGGPAGAPAHLAATPSCAHAFIN